MKNLLQAIMLTATLLLLCQACQSDPAADNQQADTPATEPAATFVANPQPIAEQEVTTLPIGAKAPDFNLPNVDGKFYSLSDFADAKVLVIVFTCNHCPTAQAYEERIKQVTSDYQDKGVQVVAISPNSPNGVLYEELGYTDLDDEFDAMVIRADDMDFNFPYLYDGDTEEASLKYGPVATPHVYVFDQERSLQYIGRLDDSEKPGSANSEDLRAAIDALLAGRTPEVQTTKTFGCSTKWGWKTAYRKKIEKEWAEKPVSLSPISEDGIKALVKNEDSDKLRLINVWATWCGPCIIEYPEFIVLQRMYGARDFEFVSLSADKPTQQEKALKFLESKNSAVTNYIFDQDDKYALIEAIDPDWNGALPYTLLVEPGGEVVWAHQGEVDFLELKRTIVDHKMIGRYY
ncbi:redoxin domain-containing protein [Flavilitoribacter nigricans]|uniref:Redoxin n=1 Tax=Flavilitoribacter nigricans (strain ATCC 23147 / DSM 23189 / NBRC 102662 / NCIMB 1420 / SS-2) TaxID=1122177 RepID=A0A2D0N901_FLAN2|nr:redoxin domain-containing protein [Flavilitoribacter nigricans]PHN04955.1 redoxin [Flavilitoribacter nigricans DSM 23189 = NBRC 102662]